MKKMTESFLKKMGEFIIRSINDKYKKVYPLEKSVQNLIEKYSIESGKRINTLNDIRVINIGTVFWANTGAFFALLITLISLILAIILALPHIKLEEILSKPLLDVYHKYYINLFLIAVQFLFLIIIAILIYRLLIYLTVILLRKVLDHLTSEEYANISLNGLSDSQILTFIAYKMYLLCSSFEENISMPVIFDSLVDKDGNLNEEFYEQYVANKKGGKPSDINRAAMKLEEGMGEFISTYHKKLSHCTELKNETVKKLRILEREFCHHILKFSTVIFDMRIKTLKANVELISFMTKPEGNFEQYPDTIKEAIKEIISVIRDTKERRMRALGQLIIFDDIHEEIIRLASVNSTSLSLKVFTRSMSRLMDKLSSNGNENRGKVYEEFEALLHRSKAHYGADLLISLENFYSSNYKRKDKYNIPEYLYNAKFGNEKKLSSKQVGLIKNIRLDLMEHYKYAMKSIFEKFGKHFENLQPEEKDGNIYWRLRKSILHDI